MLAPIAAVCGLLALGAMRLARNEGDPPGGAAASDPAAAPVAAST